MDFKSPATLYITEKAKTSKEEKTLLDIKLYHKLATAPATGLFLSTFRISSGLNFYTFGTKPDIEKA